MTDFQFKEQQNIDQDYQGVCVTKFSFVNTENLSQEQLLDQFIHSSKYFFDSLREIVKQNPEPFLRQAFDPTSLSIHDFKTCSKAQVVKFLQDFENEDNWGDTDKEHFNFIKNQFLHLLDSVKTDRFFIISKDWFAKGDPKVRQPEEGVYIYYFLIIWIENNFILSISEWAHD